MFRKIVLLLLISTSCTAVHAQNASAAPNYNSMDAWAAYPGKSSAASSLPPGIEPIHRDDVAVFFVHPTTYLATSIENAPYDATGETRRRLDENVLKFQASIFNFSTHLYAPRYRQASLAAIVRNDAAAYATAELAYQDVQRAFDAFLKAEPDRPFILASHSQGSIHALRLLQQKIAGTPIQKRLIAAYLAGVALPVTIEKQGLPLCHDKNQTGCLMAWNSVRSGHDDERRRQDAVIWLDGHYQAIAGQPLTCFNPLTASLDAAAPASANLGAVYSAGRNQALPAPIVGRIAAACENGLLGVDIPFALRRKFGDLLTLGGIYHDFDFDLFYVNVRQDALRRTDAWHDHAR